jgi:hypothetical protein
LQDWQAQEALHNEELIKRQIAVQQLLRRSSFAVTCCDRNGIVIDDRGGDNQREGVAQQHATYFLIAPGCMAI